MYDKSAKTMFSQLWRVSYSDKGQERGELWINSLDVLDKLMEPTRPTTSNHIQGSTAVDRNILLGNTILNLNLDLFYNYADYFCSS